MDAPDYRAANVDAWHAICELMDACFVSATVEDPNIRLQYARSIAEALRVQHGAASEGALLLSFADICGALLWYSARGTGRHQEAMLDLVRLLGRETDFTPRNNL